MNSLEIEIHSLFQEGSSIDFICRELVQKYEKNEALSPSEIEGLGHFLITCGRFDLLQTLLIKSVKRSKLAAFPTGLALEAIRYQNLPLSEDDILFLNSLIDYQPNETSAPCSPQALQFSLLLNQHQHQQNQLWAQERQKTKTKLIEQLNQNRLYQLHEQEENTLQQLTKLFPNDIDVGLLKQAHLERKADDILSKIISQKNISKPKHRFSVGDAEMQSFIDDIGNKMRSLIPQFVQHSPDQIYNLAILAFQFEMHELVLEILQQAPATEAREWLKAEALLECNRYLDLLKLIEDIESHSQQSDTTFGATYLRALAYHGLGQKDYALRLLQSLSEVMPSYRSTEALLHEWRQS